MTCPGDSREHSHLRVSLGLPSPYCSARVVLPLVRAGQDAILLPWLVFGCRLSVFAGRRGSESAHREPNTDNRKPDPMPSNPAKLVAAAPGRWRAEQYCPRLQSQRSTSPAAIRASRTASGSGMTSVEYRPPRLGMFTSERTRSRAVCALALPASASLLSARNSS